MDDQELTTSYTDGATIVTFGFDTDNNLLINENSRFERRGNDSIRAYVTSGEEDEDLSGTGVGGDWLLRGSRVGETNPIDVVAGDDFLIKYGGTLPTSASGQIWDLDAGEQWRVAAFDEFDVLISFVDTSIGAGGSTDGPLDGKPETFSFADLSSPISTIRISYLSTGTPPGFAFDNFNATQAVPEPSSFALMGLFLAGLAGHRLRRRRKQAT